MSPAAKKRKAKKLVLVVIDALKPAMLDRAIATGRAPALQRIRDEGVYVDDCVAAFPSCYAGVRGDDHDRRRTGSTPDPLDELVPP